VGPHVRVSDDGTVRLPALEPVHIAGRSEVDAADMLAELYRSENRPRKDVGVTVLRIRTSSFNQR